VCILRDVGGSRRADCEKPADHTKCYVAAFVSPNTPKGSGVDLLCVSSDYWVFYIRYSYTRIYYYLPPPPSISSINGGINAVRIEESKWTKDTNVEIVGTVNLTGDRSVKRMPHA